MKLSALAVPQPNTTQAFVNMHPGPSIHTNPMKSRCDEPLRSPRLLETASKETTGAWVDDNGNGRPDAGEAVDLSVVVANKGTVTLGALSIADSLDSAGCAASESFWLEQGQQHECVPIQQVRSCRGNPFSNISVK